MRIDIWQSARESADVLPNGLKVRKTDTDGKFNLSMWMPKALKPFAHYAFRTEDAREAYIAKAIVNLDEHQARKAQYRKQRTLGDASLADPGAVFCYSWGYDQTNIDYFQVVNRSGLSVTLAEDRRRNRSELRRVHVRDRAPEGGRLLVPVRRLSRRRECPLPREARAARGEGAVWLHVQRLSSGAHPVRETAAVLAG